MMKKILTIASLVYLVSSISTYGMAREGKFYTHLDLGMGIQNMKQSVALPAGTTTLKNNTKGYLGSLGVGYHILDELRLDVSVFYNAGLTGKKGGTIGTTKVGTKSKIQSNGAFVSGYYDFITGAALNPYISLGAGLLQTQYKPTVDINGAKVGGKRSRTGFAYKFGIGASYHYAAAFDIDFGYQFMHQGPINGGKKHKKNLYEIEFTDPVSGGKGTITNKQAPIHALIIGLRYTF